LDEAIDLLEIIISKDSSYSPALLWLAKCYVKKAKYDEASTHYMYALNMDKENLEEVKEGLNEILKIEPDHLMTKMHLGDVYSQTGEYENAKEEFETALDHAEDKQVKIELYLHLSNIALSMQDEKGSKAYLLEARKLDPENQYLYRQLEKLYYRQLSINIEKAEQTLKNQPDDEATTVKLAKLYKKNKELEKAIQTLNFSSDDYQTELQRLSELAQCFLIQKDPYAAINVLSNIRIAHQNHTEWEKDATYWLAISYERVGKYDEALNELEKIYICDPNFRDIAKRKNDIYLAKTQESENILIETV
jgi:tetratricopeptide (TPR) repeat protein